MPTNLKNLLSRSRSRNELKGTGGGGRGEKEEIPPCSCSADTSSLSPGTELPPPPHPTTCQCQLRSESPRTKSTFSSTLLGEGTMASLRRDSSRSLFSLPAEGMMTMGSCPDSPVAGAGGTSTSTTSTSHNLAMRKCETVLALSSLSGGSSGSSSTSGRDSTTSASPTSSSSSRVKVMKDQILSTSSSALSTLLQTSNKTTTKLFSGWKFTNKSSQHPHHHRSPSKGPPLTESCSKSQLSVYDPHGVPPLTPTNRLRRHGSLTNTHPFCLINGGSGGSRHSSVSSVAWVEEHELVSCRVCLTDVPTEDTVEILTCSCRYCKDCVTAYVVFEVQEGAYDIACPNATCHLQGVLTLPEIESLVPPHIVEKHKKFRLLKDVETDCELMWCPTPGCETICKIKESDVNGPKDGTLPVIQCPRCQHVYCTECRLPLHYDLSCDSYRQKLIRQGKLNILDEEPFAACDSIKKCPFCHVPIEKDSGCAQMMCKRCKHVFCWYCLSSLDDDFLLRHYDKGPCKNKLGHSRASVVWHRTQVIGIFAGFGLLVLLASPLLILAAPCLLCCRCRYCSGHLDPDDSPVSI